MPYILVRQLELDNYLDWDDLHERPAGCQGIGSCKAYPTDRESEEEALDEFHNNIPISCLEDFEVTYHAGELEEEDND